jgi:pyruvate-formate lyase-activating enzyme
MFNKKILCLGNNDADTDIRTSQLAITNQTINHGLIVDAGFTPSQSGYYHTSLLDIPSGVIPRLAQHFDTVILLDQPVSQWSHWKPLLTCYKVMIELENLGIHTVYRENENIKKYQTFDQFLKENKSFCIYPWINLCEESGHLTVCARSKAKITTIEELTDWQTDLNYQLIRQSMLEGKQLPKHCSVCYDYEAKDIESYRQFETKEWIGQLDLNSLEDLNNITHPYYYEIRLSNKCNLMCRGCKPEWSHLIDQEYKKFNITYPYGQSWEYSNLDRINIATLNKKSRVYLTGGEPTIMAEVLDFMRQCIDQGRTDFDFSLTTNGQKISPRFLELADHFTNMNFAFSLDGYGQVNNYWRWGSEWNTVINNARLLANRGHNININTVPGIYNVTNLHLLFEFLDQEFPFVRMYLQLNYNGIQSAFNHPNNELVLESMKRCQQTNIYKADGKSTKSGIDTLHDYYSANPTCDLTSLKGFFEYNDQLDRARNVQLANYIPELEACRSLIS